MSSDGEVARLLLLLSPLRSFLAGGLPLSAFFAALAFCASRSRLYSRSSLMPPTDALSNASTCAHSLSAASLSACALLACRQLMSGRQ